MPSETIVGTRASPTAQLASKIITTTNIYGSKMLLADVLLFEVNFNLTAFLIQFGLLGHMFAADDILAKHGVYKEGDGIQLNAWKVTSNKGKMSDEDKSLDQIYQR